MIVKDERTHTLSSSTQSSDALLRNVMYFRGAWLFFIVTTAAIGWNRQFSTDPLCPHSDKDFGQGARPEWYVAACWLSVGAFLILVVNGWIRVHYMAPCKARVVQTAALNINAMGLTSAVLSVAFEWGGTCVDSLGVPTPAAIWPEWLACGPLLLLITLTVVDKPALTTVDWVMLVSFFVCLVAAFCIIFPQSEVTAKCWLFASVVAFMPTLYLPLYDMRGWMKAAYGEDDAEAGTHFDLADLALIAERFAKQRDMSIFLTVVLPLFPLVYFGGMYGYLDHLQVTRAIFCFCFFLVAVAVCPGPSPPPRACAVVRVGLWL